MPEQALADVLRRQPGVQVSRTTVQRVLSEADPGTTGKETFTALDGESVSSPLTHSRSNMTMIQIFQYHSDTEGWTVAGRPRTPIELLSSRTSTLRGQARAFV
jgi:hypothetical protein